MFGTVTNLRGLAFAVVFLAAGWLAAAPLQVLMIGNSYTAQVRQAMIQAKDATPKAMEIKAISPGGKTLEWHAQNENTLSLLRSQKWDVVVLQDQSQTPAYFPGKFKAGATALAKIARGQGARVVFYQTWGRRDGDKRNAKIAPDYKTMQKMLTTNYNAVAKALDCEVAAVGEAWERIHDEHPDLFQRLYKKDGSHPGMAGAYLVACVMSRQFAGGMPNADKAPKGLSAEDVKILRWAAGADK